MTLISTPRAFLRRRLFHFAAILSLAGACSPPFLGPFVGVGQLDDSGTDLAIGISVVQPSVAVSAQSGTTTVLQWADIAKVPGTIVRLQAQRAATSGNTTLPDAFTGPVIHLIGDGSPGSGRDALADGDNDKFTWDLTGVRVGSYVITVTIESPDGTTATAKSRDPDRNTSGVVNVTTTLPAPTLTFTNPGATDVTATPPTPVAMTWTDNGSSNPDALMVLGLDLDSDQGNSNEIILLRDLLSTDGNNGSFNFVFVDEDGNEVPQGSYTVFARLDDNANDPVTVTATGKLIVAP
jgi:hypothetical protein